jgi:hypothetical protein
VEKEKNPREVKVHSNDVEMFNFLAKFGFGTIDQISTFIGAKASSLKIRLSYMIRGGYMVNHRIFYDKPSVYTITKKANLTDLSIVTEINLRDYYHDILVIDIFLKIRNNFVDFTTERMIRMERGVGVGKSGRIPDLIGHTEDGRAIAIEVDRTDKSHERIQRIIDDYRMNFDYNEVWFYARNEFIYNNLSKAIKGSPKFKIFMVKDVMEKVKTEEVKKSETTSKIEQKEIEEETLEKFQNGGQLDLAQKPVDVELATPEDSLDMFSRGVNSHPFNF